MGKQLGVVVGAVMAMTAVTADAEPHRAWLQKVYCPDATNLAPVLYYRKVPMEPGEVPGDWVRLPVQHAFPVDETYFTLVEDFDVETSYSHQWLVGAGVPLENGVEIELTGASNQLSLVDRKVYQSGIGVNTINKKYVPEPGGVTMLITGATALPWLRRRRMKRWSSRSTST